MMPSENQPQCDGSNATQTSYTEHPRVYFAWDANGQAQCPYCGRLFIQKKDN